MKWTWLTQIDAGHTKFRPRADGQYEPTPEGDEFVGTSLAWSIPTVLREWGMLYAEMGFVMGIAGSAVALTAPVSIPCLLAWKIWQSL